MDVLTKLFDTSDFPARWQCGNWTTAHGWLHILSDLGVWSAYLAIPCVLAYFVLRRRDIPFRTIFLLFGGFILACGTTHLMEAIIFWWPAYRLAGVIKLFTAIISWATVIALIPVVPKVLAMRSPEELEREVEARKLAEAELQTANADLETRVTARTAELTLAVAALRDERELLRTTLGSIGDGVIATDIDGRVTFLNPVAETLTGWTTADAKDRQLGEVFQIVNDRTRQPVENPAQRALEKGMIVGLENHTILIAKDRAERPIDDSAAPIRGKSGSASGAVLVFRDVTERRRAEKRLAESEAESRQLLELNRAILTNIGEGLYTVDVQGLVTYMNPAAERLFGWTSEELLGRKMHELTHYMHPDGSPFPIEECAGFQVLQKKIDLKDYEDTFIRKDGTFFPVSYCSSPLRSGNEVKGLVVVFRDTTEQKRIETHLRQLAADLSKADRRKDEFLATLAHELRNPLAPIRNGLFLMRMAGEDRVTVEKARMLMERQIAQLVRLVDDLMDVSRISRGMIELRREQVPLETVLNSAVETSKPHIDQMGHELRVLLPKHPVIIKADFTRLAQVFVNLLNNSAKYTEKGGQIHLTAEQQGADVVVSVKDNGIGIAAEQLPHIFEMFSQADRSLEKAHGGLGIGLTLVKRLVEMHGGTIEATSDGLGKGAEFVVRLPIVVETALSQEPDSDAELAHAKTSLRILVVDDNRDGADSLSMMLSVGGNETRTAYDGEEAVAAAVEFRPNVILLDIGLPKLNGYEACRLIRQQPGGKESIIIAQTGWGQEEDRRRTQEARFNYHLVKPIAPATLMKLLEELSNASKK